MDLNALLQKLTAPACVSGSESAIAETAAELLRPFCDTVEIVSGNVCGTLGSRQAGKPTCCWMRIWIRWALWSRRSRRTALSVWEMWAVWNTASCRRSVCCSTAGRTSPV
ncbi:MAG: hypothetical protein ACLUSL_12800 [Ruminococcus sp.]